MAFQIQNIVAQTNQQQACILPDGTQLIIQMYYSQQQYGWYFTILTYGSLQLNGLRITVSPNMLYQWKNKISIGLACTTTANREPTQLQDFSSGLFQLYILTADEVLSYTKFLQTGSF